LVGEELSVKLSELEFVVELYVGEVLVAE